MNNPEKPTAGYTRQKKIKQKHNTIYVGRYYAQTNTNNVNKTWALLQTDVAEIYEYTFVSFICINLSCILFNKVREHRRGTNRWTMQRHRQLWDQETWQRQANQKTLHRKLQRWATKTKTRGWTHVLAKGNEFLFLIRHLSYFSHSRRTPLY